MFQFLHGYRIPRLKQEDPGQQPQLHPDQPTLVDRVPRHVAAYSNLTSNCAHHSFPDCFRMAKGKKKSSKKDEGQSQESEEDMSGASESESEEDTDESEESSSSSDDEEEDSDVKVDDHGPPTSTDALEEFYGNRKRVDAKEVSCVLHNKTLGLYFKTM